jgi:hypothetical protein
MIKPSTQRLIQQYIDGDISSRGKEKLERMLASDQEARDYLDSMEALDSVLSDDMEEKTEIDLKDTIIQAINQLNPALSVTSNAWQKQKPASRFHTFLENIFPDPRLNITYGFFGGILVGFVLFFLVFNWQQSDKLSDAGLSGTFGLEPSSNTQVIPIDAAEISARIRIDYLRQDYIQITYEINSEKPSNTKLSFNSSNIEIWDVKALMTKPGCGIMNGYQLVEIGNTGQNSYLVLVKKLTSLREELPLEIYIEGNLVYNNTLVLN